jgi:uncharacterized repeat protein (TIGR01451 family)
MKQVLLAASLSLLLAGTTQAQNWNETTNGGGDSGIHNAAQSTTGNTALTTISGGLAQNGGDHVDCYRIMITDAAQFYATSDPSMDPAAVVGETDTRLWLWSADGSTPISVNDDTPDQPGGGDTPGLLSFMSFPGNPLYVVAPVNPVTTMIVDDTVYTLCYSYFPNDPDAAGGADMVPVGTAFEALNGPNPAATPFVAYENTGTDAPATYTIALRGVSTSDFVGVPPSADLSITKTDGVASVTAGGSTTYTITASNAGPDPAPGSTVADTFDAVLTCTWTCVGAGGGTCIANGAGNISDTVNLPVGGSVTYTASCTISGAASGNLVNTATVAAGAPAVDPAPGNNSATDTDTVGPANIAPIFAYNPASGGQVDFTGGTTVGTQGSASVSVSIGTPGSGTSTTTLSCSAPSAPFSGFGQVVTATGAGAISGGPLSGTCTLGAAPVTQTLNCIEDRAGAATAVSFTLACPAGTAILVPDVPVPTLGDAARRWMALIVLGIGLLVLGLHQRRS